MVAWPCSSGLVVAQYIIAAACGEQSEKESQRWWLTPVIPATQEAEIRRTVVQSQPRQIVCETQSQKIPSPKERKKERKSNQDLNIPFKGTSPMT
jgi:hypothetical protein